MSTHRFGRRSEVSRLEQYLSMNLYSWLVPDNRTDAAGVVAQFNDAVAVGVGARAFDPAHAFAQATPANRVATIVANSRFGRQTTAEFVAASNHFYDSTIGPSRWSFLHDGTGFWAAVLFSTSNAAVRGELMSTRLAVGAAETGLLIDYAITSGTARAFVQNGVGSAVDTLGVGAIANNRPTLLTMQYVEGGSPEYSFTQKRTTAPFAQSVIASGASALVPSALDPDMTLRIGRSSSFTPTASIANVMIYKGVPSVLFIKNAMAYFSAKYGV